MKFNSIMSTIVVTAMVLGAAAGLTGAAKAQSTVDSVITPFWVATMYDNTVAPLTLPVLFTTEADCNRTVTDVNSASTRQPKLQQQCKVVYINTEQVKAYLLHGHTG